MKFIFLLGGFAGFTLTTAASYFAGHAADRVFLDAAVGCLCGGLLFRWFWTTVVNGMREVILQRHAANAAAAAAASAATHPSPRQK
ncbi:MAG: hypothetical protein HZA93_04005 [Verrucomicrobia bacterium]|nr:hypothetical protein [Verrucomicrobiota bacterium]